MRPDNGEAASDLEADTAEAASDSEEDTAEASSDSAAAAAATAGAASDSSAVSASGATWSQRVGSSLAFQKFCWCRAFDIFPKNLRLQSGQVQLIVPSKFNVLHLPIREKPAFPVLSRTRGVVLKQSFFKFKNNTPGVNQQSS